MYPNNQTPGDLWEDPECGSLKGAFQEKFGAWGIIKALTLNPKRWWTGGHDHLSGDGDVSSLPREGP